MVKKIKVLITGGLGFVGSSVCRSFVENDYELWVIDNESKGKKEFLEGIKYNYIKADIREGIKIKEIFTNIQPQIVIHLAAMHFIPDCNKDPSSCLEVNVVGTENILSACSSSSVERVVITSSQAVYPIKENANLETDLIYPYDVYGESKMENEFQTERFQKKNNIPSIAVRMSNVYGPRETNPHVIPEIMNQIKNENLEINLGNIEPKRDYIHTSDVAEAFLRLALEPIAPGYHCVNLGSGKEYSVKEILNNISSILGKEIIPLKDPARFREIERMHLLADITKINNLVSWSPKMSIKEGLRDLCRWYGLI